MLASEIIETGTLRAEGDAVAVDVRMPWYRALPLSSIAEAAFSIDGQPVDPDSIRWTVNGVTRTVSDLSPLWSENWYVLDSATISGARPSGLTGRGEHTVDVALSLYIPYLPNDAHGVLRIREQDTKTMALKENA